MATVNLDCRLDLKTIALHARNAEYNPKVLSGFELLNGVPMMLTRPAFCRRHHANS